jgi:hypothetical protein
MMTAPKRKLLGRLESLLERAQSITFVVPDDTGFFAIEDELIDRVRLLMQDSLDLLHDVRVVYDAESLEVPDLEASRQEDDFLREIGAAISSELAAREVANLAFASRTQLMESFDALRGALDNGYIWVVASHADTGLRRVGKGLISLEVAMREYEALEPVDRQWSSIEDSLEIRSLYSQFRRAVQRCGEATDRDNLTANLRSAATRIAILRGRQIYPFLRVYDRVPIRRLQKRILSWLEAGRDDPTSSAEPDAALGATPSPTVEPADYVQEGRRLWSDLTSFAELLTQINNREDLREFDRRTAGRLYRQLFSPGQTVTELPASQLNELEKLIGRDDDLDRFILEADRRPLSELAAPLERVCEQLNRPYEALDESSSLLLSD